MKWPWTNLTYYLGICLEGLRKAIKELTQDSRPPERDLNLGPPEYKSQVLTTPLRLGIM